MKPYKYIGIICIFAIISLLFPACSKEDYQLSEEGKTVLLTFRPTLGEELNTRAIGDATGINRLTVAVYEGSQTLYKRFSFSEDWDIVKRNGITLTLIEGCSYKILFWAENSENSAYTITDDGTITVNYDNYINGGFAKMEEMDVFFGTSSITVGSQKVENEGEIELSRPLAQLNFADNTTQPEMGTHKAIVTFHSIATSFNPFTGEVEMLDMDKAFVFTDFPTETLLIDGSTYYYLSSNYFFTPQTGAININATIDLQNTDGTSIKTVELSDITLGKNKKTNVIGAIVQQPETWSVWDGIIPQESTLTIDSENRYIIDEAADIAWLGSENARSLETDKTFVLTTNIDMASKDGLSPIILPARSTFDGGEHTIKGLKLNGGLFGDATDLVEIKNLTIDESEISGTTHVGVLVNTLKGSTTFTNVTVQNTSVSTNNGAAGGMIGYIVRTTEKNRNETLDVSFTCCKLNSVSVSGSASEGKFVGLLSGYDNNEELSFDSECEAANVSVADYTSVYTKTNNSVWVTGDVTNKYDGWLGAENYRRAKLTFGGVRMAPRWDGKTVTAKTDLLLYNGENNKYEVYSPFDLAGVRNATASPAALYLMENVDMFGHGSDGEYFVHSNFTKSAFNSTDDNKFNAFSSIALLEGNNKGIYNLALNANGSDRYAFILSGNSGDVHQNISFYDCCTVVPHVVKSNEDNSYGATVVLSVSGATYKMDNIHAYRCKVFALQKTGIIAGRLVSATMATINNCSVNDCYIENYNCKEHQEDFGHGVKFYSPGEVGGLIGFVENFATISNCHVKGTTIFAFGQNDQKAYYIVTIPGRHVGQFIGDIRTSDDEKDKIVLTNCTVDSNTKCTNRWDKHSKCNMIGRVYYVSLLDSKGTVTLDGKSIL